jgi:nitroimidazol reductase NimA-like FMN-containing flavoprotein (pyridoxamine 5'-phosphate oxidase superfamily)
VEGDVSDPKATRPHMPGYAEMVDVGTGLMAFDWAVERLARARNYWLSTVRSDGRPHAMPVWAVWVDDRLWFSTGRRSRKAKNLASNSACVIFPESAEEAVIVEGTAELASDPDGLARAKQAYHAKYAFSLDPAPGPIYTVRPHVVFGFVESPDPNKGSPTRWVF